MTEIDNPRRVNHRTHFLFRTKSFLQQSASTLSSPRLMRTCAVFLVGACLAASPAQAQFGDFVDYLKKAYDLYNERIDPQPSEISQLKALVLLSKAQIISEIDNVAAGEIASCAVSTIDTFGEFDSLTPDNRQRLAIDSAKCVTDAEQQIATASDLNAVNKMGIAVNAMAPIALAANRSAGLPTAATAILGHILGTNKTLLDRLKPFCAVSLDDPSSLPRYTGSVKGHGACYNFTVKKPAQIDEGHFGGVFHLPPGPGRAFLYWQLTGQARPDDSVLYWRGHTAYYPKVNFSIAQTEAMRGTSWEVARFVVESFEPSVLPLGSPLAVASSLDDVGIPLDLFAANARGNVWRAALTPGDPVNPTLSNWQLTSNSFVSLAAAANFDGRVELFGLGRSGRVYHRWQRIAGDNDSWAPISEKEGLLNTIAVARNSDGTLQLFGTTPSGEIYTTNQIFGGDRLPAVQQEHPRPATDGWTNFAPMDGILTQIAAVTKGDYIHLFGVNGAGALWHRYQLVKNATDPSKPGTWSPWTHIVTPASVVKVTASVDRSSRLHVVCLTRDNRILYSMQDWLHTPWIEIPGKMRDVVLAKEGGADGMLVLIGVGAGNGNPFGANAGAGKMYRRLSDGRPHRVSGSWTAPTWQPWVSMPSPLEERSVALGPAVSH